MKIQHNCFRIVGNFNFYNRKCQQWALKKWSFMQVATLLTITQLTSPLILFLFIFLNVGGGGGGGGLEALK